MSKIKFVKSYKLWDLKKKKKKEIATYQEIQFVNPKEIFILPTETAKPVIIKTTDYANTW